MIDKIKQIMRMNEEIQNTQTHISKLTLTVSQTQSEIVTLRDEMARFTTALQSMQSNNKMILDVLQSDLAHLSSQRDSLSTEISGLQDLRHRMEKSMGTEISQKLQESLDPHIARLKTDVKSYNELKQSLKLLQGDIHDQSQEIQRLRQIGTTIRDSDVQLQRIAKEFLSQDKHKLELMQKVESLQRLLGKERRHR